MKTKKIQGTLLSIAFGSVLLGLVLFAVIPFILGAGFEYSGLDTFWAGLKSFANFEFDNIVYVLLFVIVCVTLLVALIWAVVVGRSKHKKHFIPLFFVFVVGLICESMLLTYFYAAVRFNGVESESDSLFKVIMTLEDQRLGKLLSMLVLGFIYLGMMLITLYGFVDIFALVMGDKEKQADVVNNLVVAPIVVEEDNFEDRKRREEEFFRRCIATGEFSQYDEYELAEPLEGYDEEPVFESLIIEEETEQQNNQVSVTVARLKEFNN